MAQKFKVNQILLSGASLTISGNNLLVNNTLVGGNTFAQQFISGLANTAIIPSANTYVNIVSGNVGPGTWLTFCQANVRTKPQATGVNVTAKLWSGSGAFFAVESDSFSTGIGTSGFTILPMNGLITLTAPSNPITLSCASSVNSSQIIPAPTDNLTAGIPSGVSTYIHMVRLY